MYFISNLISHGEKERLYTPQKENVNWILRFSWSIFIHSLSNINVLLIKEANIFYNYVQLFTTSKCCGVSDFISNEAQFLVLLS